MTKEMFDEATEHMGKGVCRADFFAGAKAALAELGVVHVRVLDFPEEHAKVFWHDLEKGSVLVIRAKEPGERP